MEKTFPGNNKGSKKKRTTIKEANLFLHENREKLLSSINKFYYDNFEGLVELMYYNMAKLCPPGTIHYEVETKPTSRNRVKTMKKKGIVDMNQTISHSLHHEYSCDNTAHIEDLGDYTFFTFFLEVQTELMDLGKEVLWKTIEEELEKHFKEPLSERVFSNLDEEFIIKLYLESNAEKLSDPDEMLRFLDMEDVTLSEVNAVWESGVLDYLAEAESMDVSDDEWFEPLEEEDEDRGNNIIRFPHSGK